MKIMSSTADVLEVEAGTEEGEHVCANCGIAGVDNIKLEECSGCDLVKYCGNKCQGDHREQHEEECMKRKKVLHDKKLFTQPDINHLGECPLCFLPMPLDPDQYVFHPCCCKKTCNGCVYANFISNMNMKEKSYPSCPFCRESGKSLATEDPNHKKTMKRVKANDPVALRYMGCIRRDEGNYNKAVDYYKKAIDFGDLVAHFYLGCMYKKGQCVEKDEEKAAYHYEKAAIGGHMDARHRLACMEGRNGNIKRMVKHFIIGAKLGHKESMNKLWGEFKYGTITKEELDAVLRAHQAAVDATKSSQRDEAAAFFDNMAAIGIH